MDSDGSIASFSNYGLKTVHIIAPGVGISTTTIHGGYVSYASGTSFAAPFVAGVAAMVLSQSPDMGYKSLREAILNSATKIPSVSSSMVSSGGCVNAYEALLAESGLDTSMKVAQEPSTATDTSTTIASASDGGGGGGGCLIETAHASTGTCASAILLMITIVLFQVIRRKDLE
jgi:subtilisin family serine protease